MTKHCLFLAVMCSVYNWFWRQEECTVYCLRCALLIRAEVNQDQTGRESITVNTSVCEMMYTACRKLSAF